MRFEVMFVVGTEPFELTKVVQAQKALDIEAKWSSSYIFTRDLKIPIHGKIRKVGHVRLHQGVRVDRSTPWGNPHPLIAEGFRRSCLAAFEDTARERAAKDPEWLKPLVGKRLLCWCYPKACHADVLQRLCEGA